MGFLDAVLKPIESAVSSVENAVSEVVKLFGEAARFLEDIIKQMLDVISRIKRMFNESKIEYLFLHPFEQAALVAIGDLEKLSSIVIKAGAPSNILNDIEYPVRSVIEKSKTDLAFFEDAITRLIAGIKDDIEALGYDIHTEFDAIFNDISSIPSYLDDIKDSVANSFKVNESKAFNVITEFDNSIEAAILDAKAEVNVLGSKSTESLEGFRQSVVNRIESESSKLDLLIVIVVVLILGSIIGIYYITRSLTSTAIVAAIVIVIVLIVLLLDYVL